MEDEKIILHFSPGACIDTELHATVVLGNDEVGPVSHCLH